ncbi:MAG: 2-isopropylmalate synthase [Bifidobacteriaceae bacterium]|nr:2-isopropylmalate synthase [Bifidobacteriaceae bacterium]
MCAQDDSVFNLAEQAAQNDGGESYRASLRYVGEPQQPSGMPYKKYVAYNKQIPFDYPERTWPEKVLHHAPRWCSVDLRDGNQALVNPMDKSRKLRFWNLLMMMGFKEVEVGFPSASETDYSFIRMLIERDLIPDDVTIVVLTQAREHLIRKTYECLRGAKRAVVHFYNSVSVLQREVVFRKDKEGIKSLAVEAAKLCKKLEADAGDTDIYYEYSPESFTGTEPEYAVEVCNAVIDVIQPILDHKMIINLPATVEMTTPNVFADQVEYVSNNLENRESIVLSLHPHNDCGMGVAAAELGLLAGADRIEGCLLGNGERTGNVDLVTLALNLLVQGIDPQISCSQVQDIRKTVEFCNQLAIDERHPYAGDFVFTAFSGSHQDAIKKGLEAREKAAESAGQSLEDYMWLVPYLPIDPQDIGRNYKAIIRVNSQSGKGGMAYLLKANHNLDLPKRLQIEFDKIVQKYADDSKAEVVDEQIWYLFKDEYLPVADISETEGKILRDVGGKELPNWGRLHLQKLLLSSGEEYGDTLVKVQLRDRNFHSDTVKGLRELSGVGTGPVEAFINSLSAFNIEVSVLDYVEHTMTAGSDATAATYIECQISDGEEQRVMWGVGIDASIVTSSLKAIISAINRFMRLRSSENN